MTMNPNDAVGYAPILRGSPYVEVICTMLAELERLRAEVERLVRERDAAHASLRLIAIRLELMAVDRAAGRDDSVHFAEAVNFAADYFDDLKRERGDEATRKAAGLDDRRDAP